MADRRLFRGAELEERFWAKVDWDARTSEVSREARREAIRMIIALIITAYLVVALLASRPVYGHLRARSIDGCARRWKSLYHTNEQFDMGRWNSLDRTGVLASATALSLLWPYLVIAAGAGRWMTGTKIRSGVEIEVERKALGARIASLEQELGIK